MLSRVAYNIYWAARYLERAENIARLLGVNQDLTLDTQADQSQTWGALIDTTGDRQQFDTRHRRVDRDSTIHFLAYDRDYPNSIIASLWAARENLRSVRDSISRAMWLRINALYLEVKDLAARADGEEAATISFSDLVRLGCFTVQGVTDATMSRDDAWHWWHIGTMVERADKTSRILDVKYFMLLPQGQDVGSNSDQVQWIALLDSASAAQMFRRSQRSLQPDEIAAFLILDQRFPRSIAFAIAEADASLHGITGTPQGGFRDPAEQALGRLRAELVYADIAQVIATGLHEYLDDRQRALNEVDRLLSIHYFGIPD